jgi:hypothetical protein
MLDIKENCLHISFFFFISLYRKTLRSCRSHKVGDTDDRAELQQARLVSPSLFVRIEGSQYER